MTSCECQQLSATIDCQKKTRGGIPLRRGMVYYVPTQDYLNVYSQQPIIVQPQWVSRGDDLLAQ